MKQLLTLSMIPVITLLSACGGGSSDSVQEVTTPAPSPQNTAPIADAGDNQQTLLGNTVQLSGEDSSDADGDALTFQWRVINKPDASNYTLPDTDNETFDFTPDSLGVFELGLIVNDGVLDSSEDTVMVTVNEATGENNAPVATITLGSNVVVVGDYVQLDGSKSSDADGDSLTFSWSISALPSNSLATLKANNQSNTEFNADIAGRFELTLIVNDGALDSAPNTVIIDADNDNIDITNKIFGNTAGSCINYVGSYFSNVNDIQRARGFTGDIVVSSNATHCQINSNTVPNHDFNDNSASFANQMSELDTSFNIPITPTPDPTPQTLGIGTTEAILLNGVTIDILPAACYGVGNEPLGREKIGCGPSDNDHPWRYDPMSPLNTFGTDQHNAHTQSSGKYHYHGNPVAMFSQECTDKPSAVIGFAADGYPIFGSCYQDPESGQILKATSSFVLKNNGGARQDVAGYQTPSAGTGVIASNNYDGQFRGDWEYQSGAGVLDECNGMTINGQYGYYVTDQFPWVINCFKGNVDASFSGESSSLERRMHTHEDGETHSH